MKSYDIQRMIVGLPTILLCFALILIDAWGKIDITKFGYAGIGAWITLILQFYFRKSGVDTITPPTETPK